MSLNQLMFRNLKKNIKNYYLYVFALVFSSALYFAFVTLQYDPAMDEVEMSIKGGAGIKAGSVLLVVIVSIFLLYANTIFIRRRSKEIGLFQLIGMTKQKIFRLLTVENFILYFGSILIGVGVGFSVSKLLLMLLFKMIGVEAMAELYFSPQALVQTIIVFLAIYLLVMLMNYLFIKKQTILSLFRVTSSTEGKARRLSWFEMVIGIIGIALIAGGYYLSSQLFGGKIVSMNGLFMTMIAILGSVIIGTYLFYKGSVSFLLHLIRKQKNGYLNIVETLSLSSIMFRMKSSAILLTIITTVSALAIGLLSLSYISYYSAEKTARNNVPDHFAFMTEEAAKPFKDALDEKGWGYTENVIPVIQVDVKVEQIMNNSLDGMSIKDSSLMTLPVVSEKSADRIDVSPEEVYFSGYSSVLKQFLALKDSGPVELINPHEKIAQQYIGLKDQPIVSWPFKSGGLPVVIVDDSIFKRLNEGIDPSIQKKSNLYIGIQMKDRDKVKAATELFTEMKLDENEPSDSQLNTSNQQKQMMGFIMFIVAFLGLTFLITSGNILYFKQMGESEEEKPNYTILRKLGFTRTDLIRGIRIKQLFSFGIPLVVGLSHSYFAVKSGWFFFGTELVTPMLLVMLLYTALYSIFGILSVQYYRKMIKEAL
ncbi:FtsX-like permease family protein [Paenibacillus sp. GCM10027627]|uniref:FtsX-like permease family protein n=1 Tax=unclassified Paenibacillus TaxID=185978 RepID=UPI00363525C9